MKTADSETAPNKQPYVVRIFKSIKKNQEGEQKGEKTVGMASIRTKVSLCLKDDEVTLVSFEVKLHRAVCCCCVLCPVLSHPSSLPHWRCEFYSAFLP